MMMAHNAGCVLMMAHNTGCVVMMVHNAACTCDDGTQCSVCCDDGVWWWHTQLKHNTQSNVKNIDIMYLYQLYL